MQHLHIIHISAYTIIIITISLSLPCHYHITIVSRITGGSGNSGTAVIHGSIGGILLIAVVMAINF